MTGASCPHTSATQWEIVGQLMSVTSPADDGSECSCHDPPPSRVVSTATVEPGSLGGWPAFKTAPTAQESALAHAMGEESHVAGGSASWLQVLPSFVVR